MSPDQIARALFETFANGEWKEAQKRWAVPITESMKQRLAGLQIAGLVSRFHRRWRIVQ